MISVSEILKNIANFNHVGLLLKLGANIFKIINLD